MHAAQINQLPQNVHKHDTDTDIDGIGSADQHVELIQQIPDNEYIKGIDPSEMKKLVDEKEHRTDFLQKYKISCTIIIAQRTTLNAQRTTLNAQCSMLNAQRKMHAACGIGHAAKSP